MEFATTDCPVCGKFIIIVPNDYEWQYICPGTEFRPCGKAFKFEVRTDDDVEE